MNHAINFTLFINGTHALIFNCFQNVNTKLFHLFFSLPETKLFQEEVTIAVVQKPAFHFLCMGMRFWRSDKSMNFNLNHRIQTTAT